MILWAIHNQNMMKKHRKGNRNVMKLTVLYCTTYYIPMHYFEDYKYSEEIRKIKSSAESKTLSELKVSVNHRPECRIYEIL